MIGSGHLLTTGKSGSWSTAACHRCSPHTLARSPHRQPPTVTLAKLAGAPTPGSRSAQERAPRRSRPCGKPLLEVRAQSPGELAYALDFARRGTPIIGLDTD